MKRFEKWQLVTAVIQTLLFAGTVIIAFKQCGISSKQNEISQTLLELQYAVSVEVSYDSSAKRLIVANKGQGNIYLWGKQTRRCGKSGRAIAAPDYSRRVLLYSGGSIRVVADQPRGPERRNNSTF